MCAATRWRARTIPLHGAGGIFTAGIAFAVTQIIFGKTGAGRGNVVGHQMGNAKAHRPFRVMYDQGDSAYCAVVANILG